MTNVFLNWINRKLIHAATKDDKTFYNVSIPMKDSTTGYGSLSVNAGQIMTSTTKDGNANDNYVNILLGKPEGVRKISIKRADGSYATRSLTNMEIAKLVEENRSAYRQSSKAAAPAEA